MKNDEFKKFKRLYLSASMYGSDLIFNKFLGRPLNAVVPLSLAHGVDFGHCYKAMDLHTVEPIHWSYNKDIHESCSNIKPSILAPHPWAILDKERYKSNDSSCGEGVLIIGPPPGPENDRKLFALLSPYKNESLTILVKNRGKFKGSVRFWESKGIKVVTAGDADDGFYHRLYDLILRFKKVIGCTVSSALFFAASAGRSVDIVSGYNYENYDILNYLDVVNFSSVRAKSTVKSFYYGCSEDKKNISQYLLGYEYLDFKDDILDNFNELKKKLTLPINPRFCADNFFDIRRFLALHSKRSIFLWLNKKDFIDRFLLFSKNRPTLCRLKIDELDVWLNGISKDNFMMTQVFDKPSRTVKPGSAFVQYVD